MIKQKIVLSFFLFFSDSLSDKYCYCMDQSGKWCAVYSTSLFASEHFGVGWIKSPHQITTMREQGWTRAAKVTLPSIIHELLSLKPRQCRERKDKKRKKIPRLIRRCGLLFLPVFPQRPLEKKILLWLLNKGWGKRLKHQKEREREREAGKLRPRPGWLSARPPPFI